MAGERISKQCLVLSGEHNQDVAREVCFSESEHVAAQSTHVPLNSFLMGDLNTVHHVTRLAS